MVETLRLPVGEGVELAADFWRGDRAPFLLVHGLASSRRLWHGVAKRLAEAGHSVVTLDLRGHGESDRPSVGYGFETMAADVIAATRVLGFDHTIVAGQSYGGNLVLEVAERHPELVRGIAAVDGGVLDFRQRFATWEECEAAKAPPVIRMTLEELRSRVAEDESEWPPGSVEAVMTCYEDAGDGTARARLPREHHLAILRSMWEHNPRELLARIPVPVLVMPCDTGDDDWTGHKRDVLAEAKRDASALRVHWFKAHHDVHLQRPVEVAEVLLGAERDGFFG